MLAGFELTGIYGYVWYLHAILTGAFLVYLPFSRMFHMIMAPVGLAMNAADKALKSQEAGKL
jgi:nitrate reductase gamma subunit